MFRSVLFEAENHDEFMYGFTDNYIKVRMPYDPLFVNEIREAVLTSQCAEGIMDIRLTNREDLSPALQQRLVKA